MVSGGLHALELFYTSRLFNFRALLALLLIILFFFMLLRAFLLSLKIGYELSPRLWGRKCPKEPWIRERWEVYDRSFYGRRWFEKERIWDVGGL